MTDIRNDRKTRLQSFQSLELRPAALGLLNELGYSSDKTIELDGSPDAFLDQFNQNPESTRFSKEKALSKDWKNIQLLFQLTDQELGNQVDLFQENDVKQALMSSYLFFAVELTGTDYARGKLADITRQLNRLFPMPVMVLFVYDAKLSVAVINRRRNKRDDSKDVLGKVTLIQNISLAEPHRGHLDILQSFSLDELKAKHKKEGGVATFDQLHKAWEEIFNVELLNKKFYRELSNWYFWAMQHVHFPFDILEYEQHELNKGDLFSDKEKLREHDAKNLIRLLTRLLFVWFIKEKGLIPEPLFEKSELESDWLNDFDAKSKDTRYYKAILQNLFFAALNQPVEKREFRKDGRQHRNITNLMRYESFFRDPDAFVALMKSIVPFMNGGLFECLDKPHPTLKGRQGGDVILYEDGFSDRKDNKLTVPDFLFFGEPQTIDLSDVYGDKKRKNEKVRGIIPILNSYKFTIVENTPIEQEIALDPELLGKVFENLLASYNPETKTTARKQTGSFYTPRTIVDYMVDQSLKAYLKKSLTTEYTENTEEGVGRKKAQKSQKGIREDSCEFVGNNEQKDSRSLASIRGSNSPLMSEADAEEGLDILFAYTEKEHAFTDAEKHSLINAIDNCKILDPACGSGAFPMGILHKLEFVLGKLDPQNRLWRDRQIEKVDATIAAAEQIDDTTVRENTIADLEAQKQDVEESFANNELGYGRKLYLIENCIYGVDIQAIATQVSRLRFFISLIVDQKVNPKKDNFGIRPLPNLEAKFATADTLIQIEKPKAQLNLFDSKEVQALEKELKQVRHNMFSAKTPKTKAKYRLRDKQLREQIANALQANGWSNASARQLANWDPYDQNATCAFFDPEWMFDLKGFDIVIGNPPYIDSETMVNIGLQHQREHITEEYGLCKGNWDIYIAFYECGLKHLTSQGTLSYITPDKWLSKPFGYLLRKEIILRLASVFRSGRDVFESVNVDSIVCVVRQETVKATKIVDIVDDDFALIREISLKELAEPYYLDQLFSPHFDFIKKLERSYQPLSVVAMAENACATSDAYKLKELVIDHPEQDWTSHYKLINTGTIGKYCDKWGQKRITYLGLKLVYPAVEKNLFHQVFRNSYGNKPRKPKIIIKGLNLFDGCLDEDGTIIPGKTTLIVTSKDVAILKALLCVLNSPLPLFYFREKYPAFSYNKGTTFTKDMINSFPVPTFTDDEKEKLVNLSNEMILAIKDAKAETDISELNAQINQFVYQLYDLTPAEIKIVEGSR